MNEQRYQGQELELFSNATNWKAYLFARLSPHICGDVLEVGAGLGGTTQFLSAATHRSWLALEPDPGLLEKLRGKLAAGELPSTVTPRQGSLADLPRDPCFDSVLYVDVLEHIQDDQAELDAASSLLRPGGHLVVLSPANPFLWSELDSAVGHQRRYQRKTLARLAPAGLELVILQYLDSVGMLASLVNRLLLKKARPSPRQLWLWDSVMVRASRVVDGLTRYRLGKSILAVWRRERDALKPGPAASSGR